MKCALVIGGKVFVAWKRKMLHDVSGGHQAYIRRNLQPTEDRKPAHDEPAPAIFLTDDIY